MKQSNNLTVGIDIRNIGKKRTGDEVVFFELVKNFQFLISNFDSNSNDRISNEKKEINNSKLSNSEFNQNSKFEIQNYTFKLFTDTVDNKTLKDIEKRLGIENREDFEIVSLKSSNKFIWNAWTLPRYLRKHPVDVYHTQYITPFFVSGKIKIITHIHDVSFKAYKKFIKWNDLFFLKILIPWSLKRADKIIAVSEFTRDEIIKYYKVNPEEVEVVYNGVSDNFEFRILNFDSNSNDRISNEKKEINNSKLSNSEFNQNSKFEIQNCRKKYNLPKKFILYIGTLQPRKNIPMLIKAYEKIKDRIPDIKLVIAGNIKAHNVDKKLSEVIEKFQIPLNPPFPKGETGRDIIFPGFIDEEDKMILIEMARLFVFPSLYEGFGIPILEAMSQNVPVAASDIPSLSEVGDNAYLKFNPRDLDEMAEKLYTACVDEELRKKLINLGQSRSKFFSWEKAAEKMLEIYKNLASYGKF